MAADRGGIAIGTLVYQRWPETVGIPLRLVPPPVLLAGREELLAELDARLSGGPGPRLSVLCGLAGAGKTSVAAEYAHRHLTEVGVCWQFPAEDPAVLAAEFAVLDAQLGVLQTADAGDPVASVHGALARTQARWLLIFDNATDPASLERFVPPAGNGRVLITTQNQHWPRAQALNVPVLDTGVAADFLVDRTGDQDRAAARELAEALGGLPLALEQAAAYIQAVGTTLAGYLLLFRDRRSDLLARGEAAGHPADVAATLGLALSRLASQAPAAAGLLRLLAFLAPEPVPLSLLLAEPLAEGILRPEVTAAIGPLPGDPIATGDAIIALRRYSLLSPGGDGLIVVHRLVQAITRDRLPAEAAAQWKQAAAALVEAALPAGPQEPAGWPTYAILLPHAQAVLDLTSDGMSKIGQYLGHSGNYTAARDMFQLIVDAQPEPTHTDETHESMLARFNLAYWTGMAGDDAGARDQFSYLSSVPTDLVWLPRAAIMQISWNLAYWTGKAGDAAGARDRLAALLRSHEKYFGPDHSETLIARMDLAHFTGMAGDAAGGRDQFASLLPVIEQAFGPDHPRTLRVRRELSRWTGLAGNAVGAHDQIAPQLPNFERILGPDHPETLAAHLESAYWYGQARGFQ